MCVTIRTDGKVWWLCFCVQCEFFPRCSMPTLTRGLLVLGSTLVITSPLRVVSLCLCLSLFSSSAFFSSLYFPQEELSWFDKLVAKGWGWGVGVGVREGEIYERGCTSAELSLGICFIFYFTVCLALLSERPEWAECIICGSTRLSKAIWAVIWFYARAYSLISYFKLLNYMADFFYFSVCSWFK